MTATLTPIRPSAAIRAQYEKRLFALVDEMHRSYLYWLRSEYRRVQPRVSALAGDESPVGLLQRRLNDLGKRWLKRFDTLAEELSSHFSKQVKDRCDRSLAASMRRNGFTVRFRMSEAMRDAFSAVRAENVGLIRSIAQQHLTQVETLVMQSVQRGRDLGGLTKELEQRYHITRRRAATIARDQNNKATATMTRARHLELGITQAKWLHSAGGKQPRERHVAFSGKTYNIAEGHDFGDGLGPVLPGEAINCRCVAQPIVPGFGE